MRVVQMATKLSEMQKIAPAEAKQYLTLPFNKHHELDRKRQAELMDNRTKEQVCDTRMCDCVCACCVYVFVLDPPAGAWTYKLYYHNDLYLLVCHLYLCCDYQYNVSYLCFDY